MLIDWINIVSMYQTIIKYIQHLLADYGLGEAQRANMNSFFEDLEGSKF